MSGLDAAVGLAAACVALAGFLGYCIGWMHRDRRHDDGLDALEEQLPLPRRQPGAALTEADEDAATTALNDGLTKLLHRLGPPAEDTRPGTNRDALYQLHHIWPQAPQWPDTRKENDR